MDRHDAREQLRRDANHQIKLALAAVREHRLPESSIIGMALSPTQGPRALIWQGGWLLAVLPAGGTTTLGDPGIEIHGPIERLSAVSWERIHEQAATPSTEPWAALGTAAQLSRHRAREAACSSLIDHPPGRPRAPGASVAIH